MGREKHLAISSYASLVKEIRKETAAFEVILREKTVTFYWRVGRIIDQYLIKHQQRAPYGDHLFDRLARDTARHKTILQRAVQ